MSKLYTNIQHDQKAKLGYDMSVLFEYIAGGEGGEGLEVLKCFVRGCQNFFYLLCVCVGGGGQFQDLSFREKITDPPPIIKWLVPLTKGPMGHYVTYLSLRFSCYI